MLGEQESYKSHEVKICNEEKWEIKINVRKYKRRENEICTEDKREDKMNAGGTRKYKRRGRWKV